MVLGVCSAPRGTKRGYAATGRKAAHTVAARQRGIALRLPYAMPGTGKGYAATPVLEQDCPTRYH
eukprot:2386282-Rhodomonas_salina.1